MNIDSLSELTKEVRTFCEARDWDPFHSPKELAIGLVTESSELLAIFRFLTDRQVDDRLKDVGERREIEHEVADTLFFLLRFCERCGIAPGVALRDKIEVLGSRYPIARARGNNLKYDRL